MSIRKRLERGPGRAHATHPHVGQVGTIGVQARVFVFADPRERPALLPRAQ